MSAFTMASDHLEIAGPLIGYDLYCLKWKTVDRVDTSPPPSSPPPSCLLRDCLLTLKGGFNLYPVQMFLRVLITFICSYTPSTS